LIILGLNAFHADSSAAILRDGVLVAAAEEERFCRTKHWAGFPLLAIQYCLREAGLRLSAVDHIGQSRQSYEFLTKTMVYSKTATRSQLHYS
jgi:carbamoyltransferase